MSSKLTYTCNICPSERQESNHWFLMYTDKANGALRLMPWNGFNPDGIDIQHLCGQACVIQAVQKWMGAQSKSQPPAETLDEARIVLSADEYKKFLEVVDRPAQIHPRLRQLFDEPSVLEYRHKPHCAMVCSNGADRCDCGPHLGYCGSFRGEVCDCASASRNNYHLNPNCIDATRCNPHSIVGPVTYTNFGRPSGTDY